MRRLAALLLPLVAAVVCLPALAAPAAAAPASSCSTSKGVLVVVDLRHFGEPVARGCDPSPTTGFDALHEAGFTTHGTVHDGTGFVCRIDGEPASYPCVNTPPANAYWSYWHAGAGQSYWTYSPKGAQSSSPGDGSVDAWVFGATDIGGTKGGPSFTPAQARSGNLSGGSVPTTPRSQPKSSHRAGGGDAGNSKRTHAAGAPRTSTVAGTARTAATPSGSAASRSAARPSTSAAPSTSGAGSRSGTAADGPQIVDASQVAGVAKPKDSGGSALPVVLGLGLVVLLGSGAGLTVLRRRRTDAAGF